VISCSLGILLGWQQGAADFTLAFWILSGGLAAQIGINLINDVEDLKYLLLSHQDSVAAKTLIIQNLKIGILFIAGAGVIAAYLVALRGWPLFSLIAISAASALSYNLGPLNFKHRGLAIIQVFMLMGIIMVQGAYYAMTGAFSSVALLHSLPISLLISLLLLSNELRDWEADQKLGIHTLTVRIGFQNSRRLYWILILASYTFAALFFYTNGLQQPLWLILPLPFLIPLHRYMEGNKRVLLTPATGRFFFVFGIAYLLAIKGLSL